MFYKKYGIVEFPSNLTYADAFLPSASLPPAHSGHVLLINEMSLHESHGALKPMCMNANLGLSVQYFFMGNTVKGDITEIKCSQYLSCVIIGYSNMPGD